MNRLGLHRPGGDERTFQHAVWFVLQIVAVLEGARLAFVGVDGHQPRFSGGAYEGPFACSGKPGAAQSAQIRRGEFAHHLIGRARTGPAGFQHRVAALRPVVVESLVDGYFRLGSTIASRIGDRIRGRGVDGTMPHTCHRRRIAAPHARRADHAHVGANGNRQIAQQRLATGQRAAQTIAHPHGQRRRRRVNVARDVEMRIEGRDFVDLSQG